MASNHDDTATTMPAEWTPHSACLMLYPHASFTFRLEKARREFMNIAKAIAVNGAEDVVLFCPTQEIATAVQKTLTDETAEHGTGSTHKIMTRVCPSDDTWARDMGPTFVVTTTNIYGNEHAIVGLDWDFNAWGGPDEGCYWPCERDKLAAKRMCNELNLNILKDRGMPNILITTRKVPIVLEGGSIHVDGEGTLLTTQECLLNHNRNPTKSKEDIESILKEQLGITKILWLPHGVDGDEDTNGHVDNFACFANPAEVVLSWTDDNVNDKVNYERCRTALALLEQETDARGRSLTVHKLPLPPPIFYTKEEAASLDLIDGEPSRHEGERMAASYVNFYIANQAAIVPQFGCPEADATAIATLQNIFGPERKVVGVHSKEVLIGGGNIHCITQQLPKIPSAGCAR